MRSLGTALSAVVLSMLTCGPAWASMLIATAGPISGELAYLGEQQVRGAEMAVADLNAAGGVLGQALSLQSVDDACQPDQAAAVAEKLAADGVVVVLGHICSGASIAAAEVYARKQILMISSSSTNPQLTERGLSNVFRICGRDDQQGMIAGNYLADEWAGRRIAVLHDGTTYGRGLADETKKQLNARGGKETIYRSYVPGSSDYTPLLRELQSAGIEVIYLGGYSPDAGLMIHRAHDLGYRVQLVSGDGLSAQDFWMLAGSAGEGTLFTNFPDARHYSQAASVVERFRAAGFEPEGETLNNYAAVQIWAQAVEQAGTTELRAVTQVLHSREFKTVLGSISFNEKGDVTEPGFTWNVWHNGGYVPREDLTR